MHAKSPLCLSEFMFSIYVHLKYILYLYRGLHTTHADVHIESLNIAKAIIQITTLQLFLTTAYNFISI